MVGNERPSTEDRKRSAMERFKSVYSVEFIDTFPDVSPSVNTLGCLATLAQLFKAGGKTLSDLQAYLNKVRFDMPAARKIDLHVVEQARKDYKSMPFGGPKRRSSVVSLPDNAG